MSNCTLFEKPVTKRYGMDLSGLLYCSRKSCKFMMWFNKNIKCRFLRLKKAW